LKQDQAVGMDQGHNFLLQSYFITIICIERRAVVPLMRFTEQNSKNRANWQRSAILLCGKESPHTSLQSIQSLNKCECCQLLSLSKGAFFAFTGQSWVDRSRTQHQSYIRNTSLRNTSLRNTSPESWCEAESGSEAESWCECESWVHANASRECMRMRVGPTETTNRVREQQPLL